MDRSLCVAAMCIIHVLLCFLTEMRSRGGPIFSELSCDDNRAFGAHVFSLSSRRGKQTSTHFRLCRWILFTWDQPKNADCLELMLNSLKIACMNIAVFGFKCTVYFVFLLSTFRHFLNDPKIRRKPNRLQAFLEQILLAPQVPDCCRFWICTVRNIYSLRFGPWYVNMCIAKYVCNI